MSINSFQALNIKIFSVSTTAYTKYFAPDMGFSDEQVIVTIYLNRSRWNTQSEIFIGSGLVQP